MRPNPETPNQLEPDPSVVRPYSLEPWWRSAGYNSTSAAQAGRSGSNLSSSDGPNNSESNDDQSMSSGRLNEEEEDAVKDSRATESSQSAMNCGQEQYMQHVNSSMTTIHDSCLTHPPHLELVGHSITCGTNPYQDPYYAGMMAVYGHQSLGYPHFVGMHHARMPLPHEMAQEPVYVNAKQYQGILRRREARAKAEVEKKLIKVRKPYLHESRHQHAMRRARGTGGRFAKKTELETSMLHADASTNNSVPSLQSHSSSGSERPSDHVEAWSSGVKRDPRSPQVQNTFEAHNYLNGGDFYQSQNGMQNSSKYDPHRDQNGDNGDCSGQQRGSIASSQASHRPLAI